VLKGDGRDYEGEDYWNVPSYEETDAFERTGAEPARLSSQAAEAPRVARKAASYSAPSPSAQAAPAAGAYSAASSAAAIPADYGDSASNTAEEEKPGIYARFKETRAYDKLQEEVSSLGDRFIEELSNVGRSVVLPALFGKIKEMFGVDLSNKGGRGIGAAGGSAASAYSGGAATGAATSGTTSYASAGPQGDYAGDAGGSPQTSRGAASSASAGGAGGGSSYATSENRDYKGPSSS
jgi:hypothetical protein